LHRDAPAAGKPRDGDAFAACALVGRLHLAPVEGGAAGVDDVVRKTCRPPE
jgi:hypothetical protein